MNALYAGDELYDDEITSGPLDSVPGRPCTCDDCECHDLAHDRYEADPVDDLPGGWLCWNCSIGQHHEHDPLWCAS